MIQDLDPDIEALRPNAAALPAADVDPDLESMRQAETPLSLYDVGFRNLTDRDIDEGLAELQVRRGFMRAIQPQAEDIPFAGFGFEVENAVRVQQGLARMQTGKATLDDEREVWRFMTSQAQKTTSGGTIAELLKSVATSGAEIATGAGVAAVGGKIAAKAAARAGLGALFSKAAAEAAETAFQRRVGELAVDAGIDLSTRAMLAEAAKAAGKGAAVLATTGVLQEAAPRAAGMTGGAWTAQSVTRALGSKMTDEEAQAVADEWNAAAAFLLQKGGGLIDGAIRQSIQLAAEGTGAVVGALPPFAQVNLLFGALFKKIAGEGAEAVGGKVAKAMMFSQPGGEVGEEFLAAVAEAAVMGDKPIVEAAMEVAEITPEMLVAFGLPGTAGAAMRRAKGGKITPSTPKALTGAGATEGGDPTQATPAAPVEGVAASRPSPVAQAEDAQAFGSAATRALGREARFRAVEPLAGEEQAVAEFLGRRGVAVTFVEQEDEAVAEFLGRRGVAVTFVEQEGEAVEGVPDAYWPGPNRAVVRRGASSIAGAAMDEAMHTWESQQTPEVRAAYGEALRELDPRFVGQVASWVARQPIYQGVSPELLAEEQRTNVARFTAGLVMYLDTAQGKADFEAAYAAEPSKFKRVLGALYDWVASKIRALPQRRRALARARLRVARNEQDIPKVAQRILEALNEIKAATPPAAVAEEAAPPPVQEAAAPAVEPVVAPVVPAAQPARTKAERQAERERRKEEAKRASRPLPGDTVEVMQAIGSGGRGQVVAQPGGGNLRARVLEVPTGQPRQFTWGEYFAGQDATAIPTPGEAERVPGQRVDVGFRGERPTGQQATLGTPRDERVTQYLEAANEAMSEPELPRQGTVGRPDLNVPLDSEATRALARAVDEVRKLDQESIPNADTHKLARAYYAADPDGARAMVEDRLARGEQLSAVDTVIATRVAQDLAARALSAEGNRDDHVDFLRWQNAYRESRSSTARSLQIVRGLGLAAQNAMLDVLSLPSPAVRREVRKIHKEAPGILGRRLKARKSKFLASQMGRPAEDPERFAAAFDTQTGRPISQERLDYLQSRLDAIEQAEAERMELAKQALRDAGYDPAKIDHAALLDPDHGWKIRRIVSTAKSTREDKVGEYVLASMLSGIYTHVKNTAGNAANLILAGPVQLTAEAMANTVVRDKASAQWGDVKAWWQGFMHALKPAALNAMRAWRTESPVFELELLRRGVPLDEARQRLDSFSGPAIKNPILGRGLRSLSLNLLLASDEYFKTIGAVAWAHALAYRTAKGEGLSGDALALRSAELLNDYTGDLWVESAFKAREGTFQDDGNTFTEQTVNTVLSMRETINDISRNVIGLPAGTLVLPFVRTTLRIAATVIRRSPLQPLTYIGGLSGRYKENTRQLVSDFGDTVVALGLMAAVMALVDLEDEEGRPFITGSAPRNKAERDMWYRLGIDPMSVRVGDSYYSYKYVEPMSTTVGVLADSLRRAKETGDMTESVSGVLSGLVEQSKDKTFLRTLGDLQRIAEESSSRTQRALDMVSYSFITTWVPNAIKQPLRAADPLFRESQQPREGESVWYQAAKGLPYDALPIGPFAPEPRYDLWGRPVVKPGGTNMATGLLVRLLNPVPKVGDVDSATKMDLALLNYNRRVERGDFGDTERPVFPGAPNRNFTRDGVKHTYSPEEYSEYVRRSGEIARQNLEPMVESGRINWLEPTKKDIDMIEREIVSARERVRRDIWRARRKPE